MDRADIATVAGLHATRLIEARRLEASAARCEHIDPERAARCLDEAADQRREATALAALLKAAGADVFIPQPNQLSLFGDSQ
jgi:hypothetical protein